MFPCSIRCLIVTCHRKISFRDHFWCDCNAQISYKFINPTKYVVNVKGANENDRLVFSESFDPNWVAKSNGVLIKSESFDGDFNSFLLPSGDTDLEISYAPQK